MIKDYKDIIDLAENLDSEVKYSPRYGGRLSLTMKGKHIPTSITEFEFNFIRNIVKTYKLKCGYECATAFGISMLAPALEMKEYNGKIIIIDCYLEEKDGEFFPQ